MQSRTVDFGIDLGTTNSAIFRMGTRGPELVPIRQQNYMPSVVAVTSRGDVKVGQDALRPDFEPAARWFKRLMGSTGSLILADGSTWKPEALSAEVLKELKSAARRRFNEDVEEAVITVPAMFVQPQCAATHEAAKLAGISAVALLQEPIAAATAFLSDDPVEGHYLVYDLGGGTFDVSLVRLRDGEMNVIDHGGDNYLGGSDFDRAMFDWTCRQLQLQGADIRRFESGRDRHLLLRACEEVRIAASDQEEGSIYLDEFDLPVSKLTITRDVVEGLIEPFVSRTIGMARDRILSRGLRREDVRAILLVGGPTQTPYIRRRLESELGIGLNFDQDPMTVVAKGAAIHASTILCSDSGVGSEPALPGVAQLELFYDPVSPDDETSIAGKVLEPAGFEGEVRLVSSRQDFDTGWRSLSKGAFSLGITLGRSAVTEYEIQLRDRTGRLLECNPAAISIRKGVRSAQPIAPYNYGVALEGGTQMRPIVKAGMPLPAASTEEFRLAKALVAGSADEVKIYFTEGGSTSTVENITVGVFALTGKQVRRTLRENERIEIKMQVDESRLLKARIYLPVLDEEWTLEMLPFAEQPDYEELAAAINETKTAMERIEGLVEGSDENLLLRVGRDIELLEATLDRVANGEIGEAERVHKQLSDARAALRPLIDRYGILAAHLRAVGMIDRASEVCDEARDSMGVAKLGDYRNEADRFLRLNDEPSLQGVYSRAWDLFWTHWSKTRECWETQTYWLRQRTDGSTDPVAFYDLVRRAEEALDRDDLHGVRIHVERAWTYLPNPERLKSRFYDAAVR